MFRRPTVFVVGAGASSELGMPMGAKLLHSLATTLNLRWNDADQFIEGDHRIAEMLRTYCNAACKADPRLAGAMFHDYVMAGRRIAEAAREGSSIDAIIDQHEDKTVEWMGKLGIAREILKAEAASAVSAPKGRPNEINLDLCKNSWLPRLGRFLVEGRKVSSIDAVFENLTVITFNYDRCIEQYLPHSLQSHYGVPLQEARSLMSGFHIFHPFGSVGRLPWQSGAASVVDFGNADCADLLRVSGQIRTFTEQLEDAATLDAMRTAMQAAERIVYLGFAYHRPNLDLIKPTRATRAKSILGTAKGISGQNRSAIQLELAASIGAEYNLIELNVMDCAQMLDEYSRTLTS